MGPPLRVQAGPGCTAAPQLGRESASAHPPQGPRQPQGGPHPRGSRLCVQEVLNTYQGLSPDVAQRNHVPIRGRGPGWVVQGGLFPGQRPSRPHTPRSPEGLGPELKDIQGRGDPRTKAWPCGGSGLLGTQGGEWAGVAAAGRVGGATQQGLLPAPGKLAGLPPSLHPGLLPLLPLLHGAPRPPGRPPGRRAAGPCPCGPSAWSPAIHKPGSLRQVSPRRGSPEPLTLPIAQARFQHLEVTFGIWVFCLLRWSSTSPSQGAGLCPQHAGRCLARGGAQRPLSASLGVPERKGCPGLYVTHRGVTRLPHTHQVPPGPLTPGLAVPSSRNH
ncbi:basic salivary proline-rich protein 1-like [Balaenoptera musculus]|uniref:Basic salivary proline-rich protein 1-like n=1 Tax=Balaenoptera musculus TaxID=9771 RepID=A0A8B8VCY3_BALMU|nr:basic salivary proline-rich protein 1-like [Balaenoptera musculus]